MSKRIFDPSSGEPHPLSRTRIDRFLKCPRCFYLQERRGIQLPSMPGFTLNIAVDALLKKEFDFFRARKEPHPIMEEHGLAAVPFQHPELDNWRNNFKGVRYHHPLNLIIFGAVDDIWEDKDGNLMVVDYKATSTSEKITLDTKYRESYKRQMEIYQWLLRQNEFSVSNIGYFVYANADKDKDGFANKLEFKTELISYEGDSSWVEKSIESAHACLVSDEIPKSGEECEYCRHHQLVSEAEKI
jgi:hypothetical protein